MARHPHSDNTEPDEGFLSRWSRRKQRDREQEAEPPVGEDRIAPDPVPASAVEEAVKTDADMPPLESITDSSSVADFFSPGVSEQLRKMALRKLFQTAKFNVRDGLDDYDEDFRDFAALGDIVTADMKHQQELAEARNKTGDLDVAETGIQDGEADMERTPAADQEPQERGDGDTSDIVAHDAADEDQPGSGAAGDPAPDGTGDTKDQESRT